MTFIDSFSLFDDLFLSKSQVNNEYNCGNEKVCQFFCSDF